MGIEGEKIKCDYCGRDKKTDEQWQYAWVKPSDAAFRRFRAVTELKLYDNPKIACMKSSCIKKLFADMVKEVRALVNS